MKRGDCGNSLFFKQCTLALLVLAGLSGHAGAEEPQSGKDPGDHKAPSNGQAPAIDLSVDESSGKARYSIPIELPPGPGGLQPAISLSYDGTTTNGPFGIGWNLPTSEVRCSSRFGVPRSQVGCAAYEINGQLLIESLPPPPGFREFRTAVESFQRIRFYPSGIDANTWEAVTTDGTVSRFGVGHTVNTPSRIQAGGGVEPEKTVIWKLTSQQDVFGNQVLFTYASLGDPGMLYLNSISYANDARRVEIAYSTRPDPIRDFRGGVLTEITHRGTEIVVRSSGSVLSRHALRYEPITGETIYDVIRSRLRGVQKSGVENCTGQCLPHGPLPEMKFEYSKNSLPATPSSQWTSVPQEGRWKDASGNNTTGPPIGRIRFADVNGDGLQDAIEANCPPGLRPCDASEGLRRVWIKGTQGWRHDLAWSNALNALTVAVPTISVQYTPMNAEEIEFYHPGNTPFWNWNASDWGTVGALAHSTCGATTGTVVDRISFDQYNMRYDTNTSANTLYAEMNWHVIDLNGDGLSDLIASARAGGVWITHNCDNTRRTAPQYVEGETIRVAFMNTGSAWVPAPPGYTASLPDFSRTFVSSEHAYKLGDDTNNVWHSPSNYLPVDVMPDNGYWGFIESLAATGTDSWCRQVGLNQSGPTFESSGQNPTACFTTLDFSPEFVELNGDGLIDIVVLKLQDSRKLPYNGDPGVDEVSVSNRLDVGVNSPVATAYIQNADGSGFSEDSSWNLPFPHSGMTYSIHAGDHAVISGVINNDIGVRFADLNGDSLTDVIWTDPGLIFNHKFSAGPPYPAENQPALWDKRLVRPSEEKGVLINTGSGWCSSQNAGPCAEDGIRYRVPEGFEFTRLWDTRNNEGGPVTHLWLGSPEYWFQHSTPHLSTITRPLSLADVNGDGLSDLIFSERWVELDPFTIESERHAWIHDPSVTVGSVWASEDSRYQPPIAFNFFTAWESLPITVGNPSGSGGATATSTWMDVNSDGINDLVYDGVFLNHGNDPNAGGAPTYTVSNSSLPDLLTTVHNGQGGRVEFEYQTALQARGEPVDCSGSPGTSEILECRAKAHAVAVQASQPSLQETLPTTGIVDRWTRDPVVKSIRSVALNQPQNTPPTLYTYSLPRWDLVDRSSLGFRVVGKERADGTYEESFYYQTPGIAGKLSRRTVYRDVSREAPIRCESSIFERFLGGTIPGSITGTQIGRQTEQLAFNEYGDSCDDSLDRGAVQSVGTSYNDAYGFNFVAATVTESPSTGTVTVAQLPNEDGGLASQWIVGLPAEISTFGGTSSSDLISSQAIEYEAHGKVWRVTQQLTERGGGAPVGPNSQGVTETHYDAKGNVSQEIDADGRVTDHCYDGDAVFFTRNTACPGAAAGQSSHSIRVATRNNMGKVDRRVLHPILPLVLTEVNAYTDVPDRRLDYDAHGRLIYVYLYPNTAGSPIRTLKYIYDDIVPPNQSELRYQEGKDGPYALTRTVGDGLGGVWKTITLVDPDGTGPRFFGKATWSDPGNRNVANAPRLLRETYNTPCAYAGWCASLTGQTESNATLSLLDGLGRPVRIDNLDGTAVTSYRSTVRSAWAGGGPARQLDAVLVKNAKGHLVHRGSDGDRVVVLEHCSNTVPSGTTSLSSGTSCTSAARTLYDYTPDGKLEAIYDPAIANSASPNFANLGHQIRYEYDTGGRTIAIQDPDAGLSTMTYFPSGLVDTTTNSRGQVQAVQYDDLGRPEYITKPQGEDSILMLYRADELKIWRESATPYWKEFSYDAFGRVAREVRNQGGRTFLMDTEWDQLERPTLITYPITGMKVRYEYVGAYLKKVCELGNQTSCNQWVPFDYITDVQYDGLGRRVTVAHGGAMNRTFGYNGRYYLDHHTVDQTYGDYLWSYTAGNNYDELGNVTQAVVDETVGMATPLDATHVYTYDTQNRIATWNLNSTGDKAFGYDSCGNLTNHEGDAQTFSHPTHQHAISDRAIDNGVESYTYDDGGNVASITGGVSNRYFKFDSSNHLVCVGTSPGGCEKMTVYYDAAGKRIRQEENGIDRDFIGDGFEFIVPVGGTNQARIDVNAMGENIAYRFLGNAALRTATGDALGIEPRTIAHWLLMTAISGVVAHFVLLGGLLRERRRRWAV